LTVVSILIIHTPIPDNGIPKPMKIPPCQFTQMLGKMKILSMEARTALSAGELSDQLRKFFGNDGLGLGVKVDCPGRLIFDDGEGYVSATFRKEGNGTLLNIVTSGRALQVKRFVSELP
jgi:hypothetical protein